MSWQIQAEAIDSLARGAAVLGTGGGGDPHVGALLARAAVAEHGPVTVVGLDELADDALLASVAMMGAPTVMIEKLPGFDEVVGPVRALERSLGSPITHVACAEIGGVNSTIPIAAAAVLGLPLVDADGMGRAFPELQMVLPTLSGVTATPMALADEKGNSLVLDTVSNLWTERIARVATVEMGCSLMLAGFSMSGAMAKSALVADSLSISRAIGSELLAALHEHRDPVSAVVAQLGGREVGAGKVVDVARATTSGFARGTAIIEGASRIELSFQNEHLVATVDGTVRVTTPDLIVVLEHDTGAPITTEGLRYGQRVRVIAAPADERWHSPGGLELVGPSYFGYDIPPTRFDGTVSRC